MVFLNLLGCGVIASYDYFSRFQWTPAVFFLPGTVVPCNWTGTNLQPRNFEVKTSLLINRLYVVCLLRHVSHKRDFNSFSILLHESNLISSPNLDGSGCSWGFWDDWLMFLLDACQSWRSREISDRGKWMLLIFRKHQKDNPGKYRTVSLPLFLDRNHGANPLDTFFSVTWRIRLLVTARMDQPRVKHAWPVWLPCMIKWLDLWMSGEQWMSLFEL